MAKVDDYHALAKEHKKNKAKNEKEFPEATAATPTMMQLIAWSDKHAGKGQDKKAAAKELQDLGYQVDEE